MIIIKIEQSYRKELTFVDVRSPKEFAEDHIPGAINIPLFDNEERAIVGTIYKQESQQEAINKGLKIFSKKLPNMVAKYQKLKQPICIYCWRGGMRSRAIVSLLDSIGFNVMQLKKGYKDYRRFVIENIDNFKIPPIVLIYGLTGTGKTEILQKFNNNLDLEKLANHRGSIFGDINLTPNTQKMFESLLLKRLLELKKEKIIISEGESRKIGNIILPENIWKSMKKARNVKLVAPIKERTKRIYKIYCNDFRKELFIEKMRSIEKHIGKKKTEEMIHLLEKKKIKELIKIILEQYYDHLYMHTINDKEYLGVIQSKEDLIEIIKTLVPQS